MIVDLDEAQFRLDSFVNAQPCLRPGDARDALRTKQYRYSLLDLYQWKMPERFRQHPYGDRYRSYLEGERLHNSHSLLEVRFGTSRNLAPRNTVERRLVRRMSR